MRIPIQSSMRRMAVLATLGTLLVAAPPAMADSCREESGRKGKAYREHRQERHHDRGRHQRRVESRRHHPAPPRVTYGYQRHAVPYRVYVPAPVYYYEQPYYFHLDFGIYFGDVALSFGVADLPPSGYAYWDPCCGATFGNLVTYRDHLQRHQHQPLLDVVFVGEARYRR